MIISLNPTYLCNFRCPFCYLTPEQLSDKKFAALDAIQARFDELLMHGEIIDGVDLYGGEVTLLEDEYVNALLEKILTVTDRINIITNLSNKKAYLEDERFNIYVSYDHKSREKWLEVYENLTHLGSIRPVNILMLTSKMLTKQDVPEIISYLNKIPGLESVEIKPYSPNQANQQKVDYPDHEEFIKKFLDAPEQLKCVFHNEDLIIDSLNGTNNSFSDDHIYITPNAKFAVLDFDSNNNEFFMELNSFSDYIVWTQKEKAASYLNGFCSACPYLGSCLSEHLREVKDITKSCNGYKLLLDWYDENREWKRYSK